MRGGRGGGLWWEQRLAIEAALQDLLDAHVVASLMRDCPRRSSFYALGRVLVAQAKDAEATPVSFAWMRLAAEYGF